MKTLLITAGLFVFSAGVVSAQGMLPGGGDSRGNFHAGIKAGANYSNVWDMEGQDFEADGKIGFAGGAFLAIPVGRFIGLQPELMISQKGVEVNGTLRGSSFTYQRTLTYIDVPVQLAIKPTEFLTILAGPHYSYLLKRADNYTYGSTAAEQERDFENENVRRNSLGVTGGFDINLGHVVISPRAGLDFVTNNGDGMAVTPRYRNNWIQLTVGLRL